MIPLLPAVLAALVAAAGQQVGEAIVCAQREREQKSKIAASAEQEIDALEERITKGLKDYGKR